MNTLENTNYYDLNEYCDKDDNAQFPVKYV